MDYSRYDNENSANRMEVDFLIRKNKQISPIEVKSSKYNTHSSIDKFKLKFGKKVGTRYIIYTKDYKEDNDIIFLPIYMTAFI